MSAATAAVHASRTYVVHFAEGHGAALGDQGVGGAGDGEEAGEGSEHR